jgi:hypothetical protein
LPHVPISLQYIHSSAGVQYVLVLLAYLLHRYLRAQSDDHLNNTPLGVSLLCAHDSMLPARGRHSGSPDPRMPQLPIGGPSRPHGFAVVVHKRGYKAHAKKYRHASTASPGKNKQEITNCISSGVLFTGQK